MVREKEDSSQGMRAKKVKSNPANIVSAAGAGMTNAVPALFRYMSNSFPFIT